MPTNNETRHQNLIKYRTNVDEFFTDDGTNRLRSYLSRVEIGQPKVYTAPFAKGVSIDKVLQDWLDVLGSISERWPSLWEFENDLAKKVGPLSVQKPLKERMDDIRSYYEDILLPSEPVDARAIKAVCSKLSRLSGLRRRGLWGTVEKMKKSTNSGSPYFTKRRNVVQDTVPCAVQSFEVSFGHEDAHRMVDILYPDRNQYLACAVLGWRGQEGGPSEEDVKQRVVWMFPFAVNAMELCVYQPLIESAQKFNVVPAWVSMESVDAEVTKLFDSKAPDDLVICTDFSRFDQHFNSDMQQAAKDILSYLLTDEKPSHDWLEVIFPIKYYIPLCTGGDDIGIDLIAGGHGMGSGSGGTNVDETLTHMAMQFEVAQRNGQMLNPHSMCLGDDGILSYPGVTVDDVVRAYSSHGQECNVDKQYASTQDCVYLRRWHHQDYRVDGVCVGVYSTCRAIGRLRYLERFMDPEYWSPELVALRQLSIIENCKWHPLFEEFVQFCMKRDKYRLGIDIPGFLDNITHIAEEATDHMQDFLGYTKTLQNDGVSGISEWKVVKYLKSIR